MAGSIEARNVLGSIQHSIIIKTFTKMRTEKKVLGLIKGTHENPGPAIKVKSSLYHLGHDIDVCSCHVWSSLCSRFQVRQSG